MLFKIHIYSIMNKKVNVMHWGTFKYIFKNLQKISFKNSFVCKSFFSEKKCAILFQSNPFSS
jgi:hypothetical protein